MRRDDDQSLPETWTVAQIADLATINPGLNKSDFDDDLEVSFVPMPAVAAEIGYIDVSATRKFAEVKKGYTAFSQGDVLFAKITPCMENGKMAVVPPLTGDLGFGSTEFHVLRPRAGISAEYLYYYVSAQPFRREAEHNMTGAVGQRRVPMPYLAQCEIPIAPTNEQRRIVAKIEELFSELDKGVETLTAARAQLKAYRQSVLKHAFEGKLTEDWRARNADKLEAPETLLARIKQEREACYQQALDDWQSALATWRAKGEKGKKPGKPKPLKDFPSEFNDLRITLPDLPNGWAWSHLGWCSLGPEYGTAAKSSETGAVPVVRMGNLQNGRIDWDDLVYTSDEQEIAQYALRPGDVLFNRTNSPELVGKTSIYKGERPALFAGYLVRVNQIESIALGKYLTYFLSSPIAHGHGNTVKTDGVNQSNINGTKLQEYPFPFCSTAEQAEIVRLLEEKLEAADVMEAEIEAGLVRAASLRQAILKRAFSGKLVPQDSNDEPASSLLARIRAERAAVPQMKRARGDVRA
jgi:type I restriction enzyme S subunit